MKKKKLIQNRFFQKTFAILCSISILTVLYFGVYLNSIVSRNLREQNQTLNFQQLIRARDSVDTILELLSQNMQNTLWEETVREALINPGEENPLQEERILGILSGYPEGNALIQRTWLYIPYTDQIYSSMNTCVPASYSTLSDVLAYYQSVYQKPDSQGSSPFSWRVLSFQNEQYLITELHLPSLTGAMIIQLDHARLLHMIQAEFEDYGQTIYIYDESGKPLSNYYDAGLTAEELEEPENFVTLDAETEEDAPFYKVQSELSSWIFLTDREPEGSLLGSVHGVLMLLPILLIYFLLSLGLAYMVSRRIYRPIYRLLQTVMPEQEDPWIKALPGGRNAAEKHTGKQRTELDDLQDVFRDTVQSNQQMEQLMEGISRDVVEQLLRKLILRRELEDGETEKILRGFGKEQLLQGRFVVWACQILGEEKQDSLGIDQSLYQKSFLQVARGLEGEAELYAFFTMENLSVVILCFPEQLSAFQIKETAASLNKELHRKIQEMPYWMLSASSRICKRLEDISFAYQEALEQLQHQQYEDASTGIEEEPAEEAPDGGAQYRRAQLRLILDMTRKGHAEEARQLINQEIQEMAGAVQEEERLPGICEHFLEDVIEAVLSQNIAKGEVMELLEGRRKAGGLSQRAGREEQLQYVRETCSEILGILASNSRKNRYKYVEEAKAYIKEHCADSSLSLNDIGEVIGISGQYLSSLFKEIAGESFTNYLNSYRVKLAEQFLCMTELPVKEVGYRCGFNSFQSFSRVFKKHASMTPGQYREMRKKEGGAKHGPEKTAGPEAEGDDSP